VLFILIKKGLLTPEDEKLLSHFQNTRHYFLQKYFDKDQAGHYAEKDETILVNDDLSESKQHSFIQKYIVLTIAGLVIFLFAYLALRPSNQSVEWIETEDPDIKLTIKSVQGGFNPPCDILFEYDLSNVIFDQAHLSFLDQKIPVVNKKGSYIHTFTAPLITEVQLALDHKVKKYPFQINSNGWMAPIDNLYLPVATQNGILHMPLDNIPASILSVGNLYFNHSIIRDFNIYGDEMIFEARVKNPTKEGGISCNDISFNIHGVSKNKTEVLTFNLLIPGCERYAKIRAGNTSLPKQTSDILMTSGINTEEWVDVKAVTHNKTLTLYANGTVIHELPYDGSIGKFNFLLIGFKGSGSVDWVRMSDYKGEQVFEDNF